MKNIALITGASSGIGKELASLHAERGGDLIIVARREDKLKALANELTSRHSVQVKTIVKDLASAAAAREVYEEVTAEGLMVDCLINNAGFGGRGKFHERDWEADLAMMNLNIVCLTALCRFFLPDFVKRGRGRILNVSSTASLVPGPLQAVYFATKAFVTSLSNALAEELRGTGVTVTALLPGATETEFASTSGMDKTSLFSRPFSARDVARDGYEGMLAGKLNVITGVTLSQRLSLAMAPIAPKSMVLKQVRESQEVSG